MKILAIFLLLLLSPAMNGQSGFVYYQDDITITPKPPKPISPPIPAPTPRPVPTIVFPDTGVKCDGVATRQIGYVRTDNTFNFKRCDALVAGSDGSCVCDDPSPKQLYRFQASSAVGPIQEWAIFQWNTAQYSNLGLLEKTGFSGLNKSFSSTKNDVLPTVVILLDKTNAYLSYRGGQERLQGLVNDILRYPSTAKETPVQKQLHKNFLKEILAFLTGKATGNFSASAIAIVTDEHRGILFETNSRDGKAYYLIGIKKSKVVRKLITKESDSFEQCQKGNGQDVLFFFLS